MCMDDIRIFIGNEKELETLLTNDKNILPGYTNEIQQWKMIPVNYILRKCMGWYKFTKLQDLSS